MGAVLLSPSDPVSGTGTGFGLLSSREKGFCWLFCLVVTPLCGFWIKSRMIVCRLGVGDGKETSPVRAGDVGSSDTICWGG